MFDLPKQSEQYSYGRSASCIHRSVREKMTERIRGVLAPVVTPFKADLSPDSQRFIAHCRWLLSQNCGLAVFGTNSQANSLSMEERATQLDELGSIRRACCRERVAARSWIQSSSPSRLSETVARAC